MGHWDNTAQTDHVTLWPWLLALEIMAPAADAGHRPPSEYQVGSFKALVFGRYGARCVSALIGLVTLTSDLLTLKLVCESHLRWGTFLPYLGTLGLWVLKIFAMYATVRKTDRRTNGWTDKSNAYCPLPYGREVAYGHATVQQITCLLCRIYCWESLCSPFYRQQHYALFRWTLLGTSFSCT